MDNLTKNILIGSSIMKCVREDRNNTPVLLIVLWCLVFMPVLLFPIVMFVSIFLTDSPRYDSSKVIKAIFFLNAYPLFLILADVLSIYLYRKRKSIVAALIPLLIIPIYLVLLKLTFEWVWS